ncbi:hypothetical protein [Streptomyces sp. AcH 505]
MAFPKISTTPGGPHADSKHETVYSPSRGGHYPKQQQPAPGTPKQQGGR